MTESERELGHLLQRILWDALGCLNEYTVERDDTLSLIESCQDRINASIDLLEAKFGQASSLEAQFGPPSPRRQS